MNMRVINVVGARPNFMKASPVLKEMKTHSSFHPFLVHTGQHYDSDMSDVFFEDLELPEPDIYLGAGSASHAQQTARIMIEFEKVIQVIKPDLVVVYGDVNSTLACTLVAKQMNVKVAHVEAGLRSYDRNMPEEVNRVVTDALSDLLFTPSLNANENLLREGVDRDKIHFVGNAMIDSLLANLHKIQKSSILRALNCKRKNYVVLTIHRPSNVDDKRILENILAAINEISDKFKIVFPIHPRTSKNIKAFFMAKKLESKENLIFSSPMRYIDFLRLIKDSYCVLTDSGGVQEETTFLGIPCLTLRKSTERPVTVTEGTNTIVGADSKNIIKVFSNIDNDRIKKRKPKYWDGEASSRIVKTINNYFELK